MKKLGSSNIVWDWSREIVHGSDHFLLSQTCVQNEFFMIFFLHENIKNLKENFLITWNDRIKRH